MKKALVVLILSACSFAQVALSPSPRQTFLDKNGKPLAGGKVYTYSTGTLNPLATYTDSTGTVPNSNPIILDSAGSASIWLSYVPYRFIVQTSTGVQVYLQDNISIPSSGGGAILSGSNVWTGPLNSFVGGIRIGTQTNLAEDPNAAGTLTVQNNDGTPANIGDAANPIASLVAQQITAQNQVASNSLVGSNAQLNGAPVPTASGAVNIGGQQVTCPSAATTAGASTCTTAYIGSTLYYIPYYAAAAPDTDYPTIPATATTFSNLQNASGNPGTSTSCDANSNCAAGTPNGLGVTTITNGVTTPSLSGSAQQMDNTTAAGTVNTSGKTVTYVSGTNFQAPWANSPIKIAGTTYTIAPVTLTVSTSGTSVTNSSNLFYSGLVGQTVKINGTSVTVASFVNSGSITVSSSLGTQTNVTFVSGETAPTSTTLTLTTSAGTQSGAAYASTTGWNHLQYRHLGSSWAQGTGSGTNTVGALTNLYMDFYTYIKNPQSNIVGPEWDPDVYTANTWTYKASIACYASSNKWNLYNQAGNLPTGGAWVPTTYSCDMVSSPNAWRHIQLWITIDQTAHTYTYKLLAVDGTKVIATSLANTVTYSGWAHGSGNNLNIQNQMDNNSSSGTNTVLMDKWTFNVW